MFAGASQVVPAVAKACDAAAFAVAHIERKAVGAHVAVTRHAHTRALCTHDGTAFAQDVVVAVVHQHWRHQRAKWGHWQGTRKHGHVRFRVCSALSHFFDGSVCVCARASLCVSAAERRECDGHKCRGKEQFKQRKKQKRATLEVILLELCMRSDLRSPARLWQAFLWAVHFRGTRVLVEPAKLPAHKPGKGLDAEEKAVKTTHSETVPQDEEEKNT